MSANIPENMRLDDLLKATGYNCPKELQGKTFDEATSGGGGGGDYPLLYLWKQVQNEQVSYLYADFSGAPETPPEGLYYALGEDNYRINNDQNPKPWVINPDSYTKIDNYSFKLGGRVEILYTRVSESEEPYLLEDRGN